MSNIFSTISEKLRLHKLKDDRRIVIFTVCLLIATSLWFLDALGKDYSTTLSYNVKYVNPPRNLFLSSNPPSRINLRVQAHGFTLLRHKLAFAFSPILLDLTALSQDMDTLQNNIRVTSELLIQGIGNQITNEISVYDASPDNFIIAFDSLESKVVPVSADVNLNFKPQFSLNGPVFIEPDSIEIAGPAGLIDTITRVTTAPVTFNDLETSIAQSINIAAPEKTSVYPARVTLHVPVEKYTEKNITLPLQIGNMPPGMQIKLFPSQVMVSVMVGMSNYESVSAADFTARVDYNQIAHKRPTLEVVVESTSQYTELIKVSPASVEYLIETDSNE